jgi:hypothetical protein
MYLPQFRTAWPIQTFETRYRVRGTRELKNRLKAVHLGLDPVPTRHRHSPDARAPHAAIADSSIAGRYAPHDNAVERPVVRRN